MLGEYSVPLRLRSYAILLVVGVFLVNNFLSGNFFDLSSNSRVNDTIANPHQDIHSSTFLQIYISNYKTAPKHEQNCTTARREREQISGIENPV